MSSHSQLYISEYPILNSTNSFFKELGNLIFTKEDFIKLRRPHESTFKGFQQKVKHCRQRLELIGYSLNKSKKIINKSIRELKKDFSYEQFIEAEISFENYMSEIKDIIGNKLRRDEHYFKTIRYYFIENLLFGESIIIDFVYTILSVADEEELVVYDLTEVIHDGWIANTAEEIIDNDKIIVLTEGITDTEFIQKTMEKLYPQLYGFYHFMDFPLYNLDGSASHLLKIVKTLIAANIKNKIIALFDNDAAAANELYHLKNISIPSNFKILQYPKIKLASKYPTIGPSGKKTMNINGLAGSIEMYLGEDVLMENNKFIPVYWKGFQEKSNKYQGEVGKKKEIQNKFREKIKKFNPDKIDETDWSNMRAVLELIFKAFV